MQKIKNFLQKKRERAYPYIEDYIDEKNQENFIKDKIKLANNDFKKEIEQYNDLINLFCEYSNLNEAVNFKEIYDIIVENDNVEQNEDIQTRICDDDFLEDEISTINQNTITTTTNFQENDNKTIYYIKVIDKKENDNFYNIIFFDKDFNEVENLILFKKPAFINKMKYDNILNIEYFQSLTAFFNNEVFLEQKEWKIKIFDKEDIFSLKLNEFNPNNIYLFIHQGKNINFIEESLFNKLSKNIYLEEGNLIS